MTAREIAQRNYDKLSALLRRFTDKDSKEARELVRKRVQEAREALDATK